LEESENVYRAATSLRPKDAQAWQGLVKIFEKQGTQKLPEYQAVVVQLAQIFHDAEDLGKAQDLVIKFVDYVRVNGDKLQYADALWIQLPESPLYSILEGRFPPPAQTYERIAGILEDYEKKKVNTLIGERRTRIGAKFSDVTLEVKREVYAQSKLEQIYTQLINWTNDDDLRRAYEEKLLQYCFERLLSTPPGPAKNTERTKVLGLAQDMITINHPFKLAWDLNIDWQDHKEITAWDIGVLRNYCVHFPDSDLYKVITAYLTSSASPFPKEEEPRARKSSMAQTSENSDDDDDDGGVPTFTVPITDEDRLVMLADALTTLESEFGYRLAGQLFLHLSDHQSTVESMRKAMDFLVKERAKSGLEFRCTEDSYRLSLGTALVYYQSPRHHAEAHQLFDKVLEHDPTSSEALIGVGLIFEEEEDYDQAIDFLDRALKRDASNVRVRSEAAWVRGLKGDWVSAKDEFVACIKELSDKDSPRDLLAEAQYRLGYSIWNIDSSRQARKQRKADSPYSLWLAALKTNREHAPSYTMLGLYYADYAKDKKRARRCFIKALDLSTSEVTGAERLARSFAEDGDWERVELVAQRIVDSGKVKPPPGSKRKGISWPFAALGVAQLNKQEYHKAIVSFQAALRLSPNDYHSWVGLGESYHSSGRYIAATKAILNAQSLEESAEVDISGDTWFTKYMLANVRRELGEYDEAIDLYQAVMKTHPKEEGVIIALMQTMVDNALTCIDKGLFGKSVQLAIDTIEFAQSTSGSVLETFNFWKSVGDACSVFVSIQSRTSDFPAASIKSLVEQTTQESFNLLATVDKVGAEFVLGGADHGDERLSGDLARCLHAMILSYKQAIHVTANDIHAQAVAYYNLGWAEQRAHACLPREHRTKQSNYLKAALRSFKRAIELEAGNSEFWNALGVVTGEINPSVSQHAFVRSLYLNERSPVGWTNLGTLALLSGDVKLANEAFTRAQSTDPDYAHAWLGQGFVALMFGNIKEARGLFTHAMGISEASSLPVRHHYSISMFDYILTSPPGLDVASLIQPLFALNQVQSLYPQDLTFSHLATSFQERTHDSARAVELLEGICSTLEAKYEKTESPVDLAHFTLAKIDLARAYLATKSYDKAIECGEMALGLSSDEAHSELSSDQRKKARLSAHLTVGLARYFVNEFDEAIESFEAALGESDGNPDATCLLTQMLWAQGSEEARDRAREALFEVIEKQPEHVQSVLLLGVIALLDNDEDSLEAVVESLQSLRTNDKVTALEQSHIGEVLLAVSTLGEGKKPEDVVTQTQNDIMLYPHLPHGWSALAEATGDEYASQLALRVATRGIPPRGNLEAKDLARAYAGTGRAADAQRALLIAPWETEGWSALQAATESI
jgi:superkiller protein 3